MDDTSSPWRNQDPYLCLSHRQEYLECPSSLTVCDLFINIYTVRVRQLFKKTYLSPFF